MHPAEAYASGDFTIVYALDQNDLVAGRCVVYTNNVPPQAGPVYGVSEQAIDCIEKRLAQMGARTGHDASWIGAWLKRVEYDGGFIGPYLDLTPQSLLDMDDHLEVSRMGDIDASQYNGILGGHHTSCSQCNENLSEDEYWYSEHTSEHYQCKSTRVSSMTVTHSSCVLIVSTGMKMTLSTVSVMTLSSHPITLTSTLHLIGMVSFTPMRLCVH